MKELLQRVAETVRRHEMLSAGQKVGVAVSGGADSICLLHVLLEWAAPWQLALHVLHLNHNLRGDESHADVEFVREAAERAGIPFTIRDADFGGSSGNLEQAAREARLDFFRGEIAAGTVDRVALGHTRSDQAETVLFRFLRGSGSGGLAAIRPRTSEGIVRPLIEIDRCDVVQFLQERSIPWREDSSNSSARFARNRIRHNLLPLLEREYNPAIAETLSHTAAWAQAEEAYWERELDRLSPGLLKKQNGGVLLDAAQVRQLPEAAARRMIRRAIQQAKGDLKGIDFRHAEEVLRLVNRQEGHGHVAVPGLLVSRSFGWVRIALRESRAGTRGYCIPAQVPCVVQPPAPNPAICLELIEKTECSENSESVYNRRMGGLDWQRVSGPLQFRNWTPGDQYQPSGSSGKEKLKTLFQRARIPIWERRGWPVLWDSTAIVWVRRFGPSAHVVANSSSTAILRIRESQSG